LTSYAALIGDSFASRINLPAQILRDAHDPSLGRYKERLLMDLISQFIPRKYEVGTGFVLFPKEKFPESEVPDGYDVFNRSDHIASHQCDIIVYNANDFPVVFKDGDFAVIRPESVRSVVEVKGTLDSKQVKSSVDKLIDFGRKWKQCNEFYIAGHQPSLSKPSLFVMGWQIGIDTNGNPRTDGKRLRNQIVRIYKREVRKDELKGFPILDSVYVYDDCEVSRVVDVDTEGTGLRVGFSTYRGKFVRFTDEGQPILEGDKTVASLLAGIHYSLEVPFNRFFSYVDQTNRIDIYPHRYQGFTPWLEGDEVGLIA
jgi:hypothetical protein